MSAPRCERSHLKFLPRSRRCEPRSSNVSWKFSLRSGCFLLPWKRVIIIRSENNFFKISTLDSALHETCFSVFWKSLFPSMKKILRSGKFLHYFSWIIFHFLSPLKWCHAESIFIKKQNLKMVILKTPLEIMKTSFFWIILKTPRKQQKLEGIYDRCSRVKYIFTMKFSWDSKLKIQLFRTLP